jgi:hypothetical protein
VDDSILHHVVVYPHEDYFVHYIRVLKKGQSPINKGLGHGISFALGYEIHCMHPGML